MILYSTKFLLSKQLFSSPKVVGAVASVLGRAIQPSDFETPFMELNMASMEFTRAAQNTNLRYVYITSYILIGVSFLLCFIMVYDI